MIFQNSFFFEIVKDLEGYSVPDFTTQRETRDLSFKHAIKFALIATRRDEAPGATDGFKKNKCYNLAHKIMSIDATGTTDLTIDEVSLIKDKIDLLGIEAGGYILKRLEEVHSKAAVKK